MEKIIDSMFKLLETLIHMAKGTLVPMSQGNLQNILACFLDMYTRVEILQIQSAKLLNNG